jgi:hypothetical protein
MNCIEATGDIAETPFRPGLVWGFRASEAVVRHLSPLFKNGGRIMAQRQSWSCGTNALRAQRRYVLVLSPLRFLIT